MNIWYGNFACLSEKNDACIQACTLWGLNDHLKNFKSDPSAKNQLLTFAAQIASVSALANVLKVYMDNKLCIVLGYGISRTVHHDLVARSLVYNIASRYNIKATVCAYNSPKTREYQAVILQLVSLKFLMLEK